MKTFVVISALLVAVLAHSYIEDPAPRVPNTAIQTAYCGAVAPATVNYTTNRIGQPGKKLKVQWCTCTHSGNNAVSLSLQPRADDYTETQFNAGILSDSTGKNTFDLQSGTADLVIPRATTPGEYTIVWKWGTSYFGCTDVRIDADDGRTWCYGSSDCNYKFTIYGDQGGRCDTTTHQCTCFDGFSGENCEITSSAFGVVASFAVIIAALIF